MNYHQTKQLRRQITTVLGKTRPFCRQICIYMNRVIQNVVYIATILLNKPCSRVHHRTFPTLQHQRPPSWLIPARPSCCRNMQNLCLTPGQYVNQKAFNAPLYYQLRGWCRPIRFCKVCMGYSAKTIPKTHTRQPTLPIDVARCRALINTNQDR